MAKNTYIESTARHMREARRRPGAGYFVGTMHMYCQNTNCNIREVDLRVKEHRGLTRLKDGLPCPACGEILKCHNVTAFIDEESGAEDSDFDPTGLRIIRMDRVPRT